MIIEKMSGCPLPRKRARSADYPFGKMEVEDSFFVADGNFEPNKFKVMCYWAGKKYGAQFSVRAVDGGVRVWRIE